MTDKELVHNLLPLWHAAKAWSEELLIKAFELSEATEILSKVPRATIHQVPGSNWYFKTHGVGLNVFKTPDAGGIDFDFDKLLPDAFKLKIFFYKQYNDNQLSLEAYQHLADNEELLEEVIREVLEEAI